MSTTKLATTKLHRSVLGDHVKAGGSRLATTILIPSKLNNTPTIHSHTTPAIFTAKYNSSCEPIFPAIFTDIYNSSW